MKRGAALAAALLTAGSLLAAPARGSTATVARSGPGDVVLNDVASIPAGDVWAVGDGGIVSHWGGSSWTSRHLGGLRSPNLNGVGATSPSDAWVVGGVIVNDAFHAFVSHWTGVSWHRVAVPAYPGEVILQDIAVNSLSDAWVVGRWFASTPAGSRRGAVIIHWNGTTWTRVAAPAGVALAATAESVGGRLLSVGRMTATGAPVAVQGVDGSLRVLPLPTVPSARCVPQDVIASPVIVVGTCWSGPASGPRSRPYVAVRRNGVWRRDRVGGSAALMGVDGPHATWAAGRTPTTGQPVLLRRRNHQWLRYAIAPLAHGGGLEAVTVLAPHDAWAVGWRRVGATKRPLALHWFGYGWEPLHVPLP